MINLNEGELSISFSDLHAVFTLKGTGWSQAPIWK